MAGHNIFGIQWNSLDEIYKPSSVTQRLIHDSTYFNREISQVDSAPRIWKLFATPEYKKMRSAIEFIERYINKISFS